MIRRPPRSTLDRSSAASDVYKRQVLSQPMGGAQLAEFPSFWVNILENDAGILARRAEIIGNRVYERDYFSVRENIGSVLVYLFYVGDSPTSVITLNYTTHDGTARAGQDYAATTWYTLFGGPYLSLIHI